MKTRVFLIVGLILIPNLSHAVSEACSKSGYTIATVNGIFTNEEDAKKNMIGLRNVVGLSYDNEQLNYQYLHNPPHLGGIGDIIKAIEQKIFDNETVEDYDLVEMLKDASEKVTTRKLLLVAHSQGNFYANSFYDYVKTTEPTRNEANTEQTRNIPPLSIGVYGVANPASRVAGGGKWLTSDTDKVIAGVVAHAPFRRIMEPNTHIELQAGDDALGHNFSGVYLKYQGARIVEDIEEALSKLQTPNTNNQEKDKCIDPPKLTLAHNIEGAAFAVADPVAYGGMVAMGVALRGVNALGTFVTEQGTRTIFALGNGTTKALALAATGIYETGLFVTDTTAKVAIAVADTGKFIGGKIVGAFKTSFGQTASVAQSVGNTASEPAPPEESTAPESLAEDSLSPDTRHSNILKNVGMSESGEVTKNTLPQRGAQHPTQQTATLALVRENNPPRPPPLARGTESLSSTTPPSSTPASTPPTPAPAVSPTTTPPSLPSEHSPLPKAETPSASPSSIEQAVTNFIRHTTAAHAKDTTAPNAPTINSPSANATFTTTSITFVGTAEDASTISSDFSSATVTATGGAWSLGLTLGQGTTAIEFYATDAAGNRSPAASTTVFVDSVSPDVTLTSSTCDGTLSSTTCLVATTTLAFSWSSTASDIAYFNLDKNGTFATTSASSINVTGADESTYTLKVAAVDARGNVSATSTQAIEVFTRPVVINEIAWAGTNASSFDEWVELYNRTGRDLSLAHFVLYASDLTPYIPLSGTIGAGGYFLIERTDDTTVSTVTADLVTPFSGSDGGSGLNNNGENLLLSVASNGATTTVDTVATCSGGGTTWCAGSASGFTTMERYDATVSGSDASNWYSNLGEFIRNGADTNGANLNGTPRARNSVSYLITPNSTLSANKTLTVANSPYLVNRSGLVVSSGATLTIEPGVVIKIVSNNEPWIMISGTIHANGTATQPVVFTSFYDDEYGGDMNGDGTATTPSAGNWRRVFVDTGSVGSTFTNTLVRYGGNNDTINSVSKKGAIGVDSATVSFDGLIVEKSNFHGLSLENSNSTVTNSRFSTSTNAGVSASGIYISGGSPTISNSAISGNYRGITIENATSTLSSNTFTSNSQEAIVNTGRVGSFSGNSGSGNGTNAILIGQGGTITTAGATTTLLANGLSYLVKGVANVIGNSTLSFATGVVVKGWDSSGNDYGRIVVPSGATIYSSGASVVDLIFTSMHDNSIGGTTGSGSPSAGQWYGIIIDAGGQIHLSGFTMKYAGAGGMSFPPADSIYKGALKITGSTATSSGSISNALFTNNYQSGLNLDGVSSLAVSETTFQNHTEENVGTASAIYTLNSTSTLSHLVFSGNQKDAIGSGTNSLTCTNCGSPDTSPADLFSP